MFTAFKYIKDKTKSQAFQRDFLIFRGVFKVLKKISPITFGLIVLFATIYAILLPYLLFVVPVHIIGNIEGELPTFIGIILVVPFVWLVYFLAVFLSSLYSVVVVSQVNQVLSAEKPSLFTGTGMAIREFINIFLFSVLSAGLVAVLIGIGSIFTQKNKVSGVARSALFTAIGVVFNVGISFVENLYPSVITIERLNFIPSLKKLADEMKTNFGKKILASAKFTVLREVVSTVILWSLTPLTILIVIFLSFSWWGLILFYILFLLGLFLAYVIFMDSVAATFLAIVYKYQRTKSLPNWLSPDIRNAISEFSISR